MWYCVQIRARRLQDSLMSSVSKHLTESVYPHCTSACGLPLAASFLDSASRRYPAETKCGSLTYSTGSTPAKYYDTDHNASPSFQGATPAKQLTVGNHKLTLSHQATPYSNDICKNLALTSPQNDNVRLPSCDGVMASLESICQLESYAMTKVDSQIDQPPNLPSHQDRVRQDHKPLDDADIIELKATRHHTSRDLAESSQFALCSSAVGRTQELEIIEGDESFPSVCGLSAGITEGDIVGGGTSGSFCCDFCPYQTSNKFNLSRHRKRHTGEKPFSCDYCSYRSIEKKSLVFHLFNKHNIFNSSH
ncbi:Zinc finger C2H2-type [Trinorchestia longiramus]|nr:Zinc finger C2H2-type [Trinorchestia longiramus]